MLRIRIPPLQPKAAQHHYGRAQQHTEDHKAPVPPVHGQLAQAGAAFVPVVAAAFHGDGQFLCPAKGGEEEGDEDGDQGE